MRPRIIQYKDMDAEKWDKFVYENSMGYAYHLYDVIALDRWINDKNISFVIWDDDKNEIAMLMQIHIEYKEDKEIYRLHSRWGYVLKQDLAKREFNKLRHEFMRYIDELYQKYQIESFNIALPPLSEYMQPNQCKLINPVIALGFAPSVRYTYIVNLNKDKDTLLQNCEQTTRQAIRKFKNNKAYSLVQAKSNEEDYNTYINLHETTYSRTGAKGAIIYEEYQRNIFFNLLPKNLCKIYFLKNNDTGEICAADIILLYKNTAYYWWGASINEKEVGINKYLLFLSMLMIKEEYSNEYEDFWFETGGIRI